MSAFKTVNPATGETVQTFKDISDQELDQLLDDARDAYLDWRRRPVAERSAVLHAAAEEMRANSAEYAAYVTLEMGKLAGQAEAEVGLSAAVLDYYAARTERFLAPKGLLESPGATVRPEPIGVILAIEPWNFPYYQIARIAGPQLAAGNAVILKHAESVPQCALAFARALEKAGAPAGVYSNVFATIEQAGRLIEDPRIAGVTVTGSERAGAAVAEAAGRSLKKVVMELGGSDPLIILGDADLDHAVESAVFGRMFNTGQSCVGSKRIIVVGQERGEQAMTAFAGQLSTFKAGDPADPGAAELRTGPDDTARADRGGTLGRGQGRAGRLQDRPPRLLPRADDPDRHR